MEIRYDLNSLFGLKTMPVTNIERDAWIGDSLLNYEVSHTLWKQCPSSEKREFSQTRGRCIRLITDLHPF